jgi:hypothetical protein
MPDRTEFEFIEEFTNEAGARWFYGGRPWKDTHISLESHHDGIYGVSCGPAINPGQARVMAYHLLAWADKVAPEVQPTGELKPLNQGGLPGEDPY